MVYVTYSSLGVYCKIRIARHARHWKKMIFIYCSCFLILSHSQPQKYKTDVINQIIGYFELFCLFSCVILNTVDLIQPSIFCSIYFSREYVVCIPISPIKGNVAFAPVHKIDWQDWKLFLV